MFDDLITKKPKIRTEDAAKPADMKKEREFFMNLLLDVESLLGEMQHEMIMLTGDCMFCGAVEGAAHKSKCTYRTVRMRVAMEIDRM